MATSFTRNYYTLLDASGAGAGNWITLDTKYINTYSAVYTVSLEAGDWVTIQGRIGESDRDFNCQIAIVSATGFGTFTAPFEQIRVVKTGTAGNARVALYG